ncbi:hypothetical protein TYRP_009985, partial [Tyrophagus putrescentiae]
MALPISTPGPSGVKNYSSPQVEATMMAPHPEDKVDKDHASSVEFRLKKLDCNICASSVMKSCLFWAVSKIESTSKSELFLTPYIENGKVNEGRNLSQVILPELGLKLKSYSGYLTIDKTNNANSFFWFFPAKNGHTKNVPLILWLSGGPGSPLVGSLFIQNGPLELVKYRGAPFYVTGVSYAGKYIPAIGHKIHSMGEQAKKDGFNLQGMAIGNGYCDPKSQSNYGDLLWKLGLIDHAQRDHFISEQEKFKKLIDQKDFYKAAIVMNELFMGVPITGQPYIPSYFHNVTGLSSYYNTAQDQMPENTGYFMHYIAKNSTRAALHLGNRPLHDQMKSGHTKETPVILWLSGGPGGSSVATVFIQNGPIEIVKANGQPKLQLRNFTWNEEFAVLYIDNPVGTGFSFTDKETHYLSNESEVGRDVYEALLMGASLSLQLATKFTQWENRAKKDGFNLKGLAIGNGLCDPKTQIDYGDFLWKFGLIDKHQKDHFLAEQNKATKFINEKNTLKH